MNPDNFPPIPKIPQTNLQKDIDKLTGKNTSTEEQASTTPPVATTPTQTAKPLVQPITEPQQTITNLTKTEAPTTKPITPSSIPLATIPTIKPSVIPPIGTPGITPQANPTPEIPPERKPDEFRYQKALRTFEGDVAASLSNRKVSVAQIAIAENVEKQATENVAKPSVVLGQAPQKTISRISKNLLYLVVSIVLIGGGVFAAYYFYQQSPLATVEPQIETPAIEGIIPSTLQKEVVAESLIDNSVRTNLAAERDRAELKDGQIEEIYVVMKQGNTKSLIPAAQAFPLIASNVPGEVIRSLSPRLMIGLLGENGTAVPFILARSTFFQSTFTGMLTWEERMFKDWQPFMIKDTTEALIPLTAPIVEVPYNASSTASSTDISIASSTPVVAVAPISRVPRFEDLTYRNKDLRVLRNEAGNVFFLYSFIDKENLVITQTLSGFDTILASFEKKSYIR